jgi:hypothetical protein
MPVLRPLPSAGRICGDASTILPKGVADRLPEEALARIAALYAIEAKICGQSTAVRLAVRQSEAAPLVAELKSWFEAPLARVSAKSVIAAAFRYGLNH